MRFFPLLLALVFPAGHAAPVVAIIIDDLGISLVKGRRAVKLPGKVTYSVLPFERHSQRIAHLAEAANKEVMVHLPMENVLDKPINEGGLTQILTQAEFEARLNSALDQLPQAVGANNHMGSYLTQQRQQMIWVMRALKIRDQFFVDSRTTPRTVAISVAREYGIAAADRDVFLDNTQEIGAIHEAFQHLLVIARASGSAIGIAHPYPPTLTYLEFAIPDLRKSNVRLLPVSAVLALQQARANARALALRSTVRFIADRK